MDDNGTIVEWIGTSTDIEDLKRAEVIVREAEEKFRLFVENVHEYALLQTDANGLVTSWNPGAERLFGYATEEALGKPFAYLTGPSPERIRALDREISATVAGQRWEDADWLTRKDGSRFWGRWVSEPVYDDNGRLRGVAKLLRDETERKEAEDRLVFLLSELNHRVKNTLATVQSIANQTLRESADPAQFVNHFQGRLQALGRAHSLLTQSNWDGADVGDLLRQQLGMAEEPGRVVLEGPPARLEAQTSLALAMVLHELGANARKYGALSVSQGKVGVKWWLRQQNGTQQLHLNWQEIDGPGVSPPLKRGFGTALIERSLGGVGGQTSLLFEPGGVRCDIELTLPASSDGKETRKQ